MTISELNALQKEVLFDALFRCCGSSNWANQLSNRAPFGSLEALIENSDMIWNRCSEEDGMEAFTHHPKIGDLESLERKFAATKQWAGGEQAGVNAADKQTLIALAEGNAAYEQKFGFIFIVCATGKTAAQMLTILQERLRNPLADEIKIAMNEQNKITHLRLEKLIA